MIQSILNIWFMFKDPKIDLFESSSTIQILFSLFESFNDLNSTHTIWIMFKDSKCTHLNQVQILSNFHYLSCSMIEMLPPAFESSSMNEILILSSLLWIYLFDCLWSLQKQLFIYLFIKNVLFMYYGLFETDKT